MTFRVLNLFRASVIGLITGVICFVILVALLAVLLLILGAIRHIHPDMTLTMKVGIPVAALATALGFIITLVRSVTIDKDK